MTNPAGGRIRAFDWLRGLAVVVMVETHALVLLRPELRAGPRFGKLNFCNGLVAPSFIFAAGFALALVQVRGAFAGTRVSRVKKTLRRIGEVLAVGTFVNFIWFPVFHHPAWLLRMDILQCIGLSLLIALPFLAGLARRPRWLAASAFLLAVIAFGIAPYFENNTGPLQNLLNRNSPNMPSVFPLLPWAGYVFLGASVGALTASESMKVVKGVIVALGALGALLWYLAETFVRLYPPHVFWVSDPSNHGQRMVYVCALLMGLLYLEQWLGERSRTSVPIRFLETLGTSSLAAYFFHEMLIYFDLTSIGLGPIVRFFGGHHFGLAPVFRDQMSWGAFWAVYLLLIAATTALARLTDRLYPRWDRLFKKRVVNAPMGNP